MKALARLWRKLRGRPRESPAEAPDPTAEVDRALREMADELAQFRQELARSLQDERKLERDLRAASTAVQDAGRRAEQAMAAKDEAASRVAMSERMKGERQAHDIRDRLAAHGKVVTELRESLRLLSLRVDDATRRRNALLARQKGAHAKRKLAESLGGAGTHDSFGDWEDKVRELERDAHVSLDLLTDLGVNESESDRKYREAAEAARLESSMRELRHRMSHPDPDGGRG